jgi:hypothetical protein
MSFLPDTLLIRSPWPGVEPSLAMIGKNVWDLNGFAIQQIEHLGCRRLSLERFV